MRKPRVVIITTPSLIGAHIIDALYRNPGIELVGIIIDESKSKDIVTFLRTFYLSTKKRGIIYCLYKLLLPFFAWVLLRRQGNLKSMRKNIRYEGNINSTENLTWLEKLDCDYLCVAYCLQKIDNTLTKVPHKRCVVMHASLLPKYAGPEPAMRIVSNHDYKVNGVTILVPSNELDGGNILYQEKIELDPYEHLMKFETELWTSGAKVLANWIVDDDQSPTKFQEKESVPGKLEYQSFPDKKEIKEFLQNHSPLFKWKYLLEQIRTLEN